MAKEDFVIRDWCVLADKGEDGTETILTGIVSETLAKAMAITMAAQGWQNIEVIHTQDLADRG